MTLPQTDPAPILRYPDSRYAAELLATAIVHLDLFTWLDGNPSDIGALRRHFGFAERPLDVLLTLCRAIGFITTDAAGVHQLTAVAREHLVKGSPWYLGPYYAPLKDSPVVQGFLKVLRTGKPANWQAKQDGSDWHDSMLSEDFAREFTALMNCRGRAFGAALADAMGSELAQHSKLLDVGGGSGVYAIALVRAQPHLRAAVLEQPPVDKIARETIVEAGLTGAIDVVTGDLFADPWPESYDVHLLSNVLHDWDFSEARMILERSAASIAPAGLLIIHEAFINDAKTGPLPVAEYSALLMNITRGKCYSPAEYGEVLHEAGFEPGPYRDTIGNRGFMTAIKRE